MVNQMLPDPYIMLWTKVSPFHWHTAEASLVSSPRHLVPFSDFLNSACWEAEGLGMMALIDMLRLARQQLQIFYAIVREVAVDVMDNFLSGQFATQVAFHNVAVLKHTLSIHKNTQVSAFRQARLAFLEHRPLRRYFIVSMPKHSAAVHLTNTALRFLEDSRTTWDLTYFTSNHCVTS